VAALVIAIGFAGYDSDATTEKPGGKTAGPALRQPTEREIEEWIRFRASTSKALRDKVAEVNESYEIVFVPGILGSQLQIGSFTYGKDPIDARKLAFGRAQTARAMTLNQFKAQIARVFEKNVDIYGQGLNDTQSANNGRALVEFAYDWRDDLDKLAGDFDKFLQAQLPNKKFVIVAHSMGGVIAWHWKNKFNKPRKRDLVALVTLGSPLQGSCEPVRMLVEGYGPPAQSGSFEKWATHLVFGKAHPAVLTFPSVFALLPAYDERQPCLKIRRGAKTVPLDHHEPGSWLGRAGGDYQLPAEFAAQAGLDPRAYAEQVTAAIKAGRAFRQAFDSEPYDDQIYLLYADTHTLSANTVVEPRGQKWLATVSSGQEPGDGRVSRDSAINFGNFDARRGAAVSLERDHGGLLADPRFSSFLRDNIKRLMSQAKNAEILAFAQTQSSLKDELKSRGWVADASLKTTALNRIPAVSSAMKTHVDYNYELLASNKTNPEFAGIDFDGADRARTMMEVGNKMFAAGKRDTALGVYSTALAEREDAVPATILQRMAERKLEQHQVSEAVEYGSRAQQAASRPDASLEEKQLVGKTSATLGSALEAAGAFGPAIKAYQQAVEHGNRDASKRLEALKNNRMFPPRFESEPSSSEVPSATPAQDTPTPAPKTDSKPLSPEQPSGGQQITPTRLSPQEPSRGQQLIPKPVSPQQTFRLQDAGPTLLSPQEPRRGLQTVPDVQRRQAIPTPLPGPASPSPSLKQTLPNPLRPAETSRSRQTIRNTPPTQQLIPGGGAIQKAPVTQEALPGRSSRSSPQEPVLRRPAVSNRLPTPAPSRRDRANEPTPSSERRIPGREMTPNQLMIQEPVRQPIAPNQLTPQESLRSQELRTNRLSR
jgi:pimeloyl-ACP methyl ester carboxylesterase